VVAAVAAVAGVGVIVANSVGFPPARGAQSPPGLQALVGIGDKCLDGSAGALELRTCNGGSAQAWRLDDRKIVQDGRCVGQHTGPRGVRTILELQACDGQPSQSWQFRDSFLVSATGQCANVERSRTADGTPIVLFNCGQVNGRWHARSLGP
jgi:hypothetical protein